MPQADPAWRFTTERLRRTTVIVDLFLKEGSGLSVLRAGQNRSPHQHILVLTNYPTAEIRRRCMDLGADGVYDKSTELEAFFDRCQSYRP